MSIISIKYTYGFQNKRMLNSIKSFVKIWPDVRSMCWNLF